MTTGFFWDERCFWHGGGDYAMMLPLGGFVQPMASGGLPENPETKRRLVNLIRVSGLANELKFQSAEPAHWETLRRVHPLQYLEEFRGLSEKNGGELGLRAPFARGGFDIAALSAGLAVDALQSVLEAKLTNAYALSRPPGHHCLPDWPNGFCLLANIAIAIQEARANGLAERFAVVDWDVHHGNGTEAVFYGDADVLTISLHQDRNYPLDTGQADDRGAGPGSGANMNIPLPPGTGHRGYLAAMDHLVIPELDRFRPDVIIVACGFDASAFDPLGRMLASAETFAAMTSQVCEAADALCEGRLVMVHEGGYSEMHVPFCGHAVLKTMSDGTADAPDPMAETLAKRQPGPAFDRFFDGWLDDLIEGFAGKP
ncbi:MAG: class II histone deacetylase [Pseudomonadota bacterium]